MQPVRSSPRTEAGRILDGDGAAENYAAVPASQVSEISRYRHGFNRASWYLHRSHLTPYDRNGLHQSRSRLQAVGWPVPSSRVTTSTPAEFGHPSSWRQSIPDAPARTVSSPLADILLSPDRRTALCTDHFGQPILYSGAFCHWLNRMAQTRDYLTESTRPAVMESLEELVSSLTAQDTALRERCFLLANEALATCNDNVADALNDMHALVFDAAFNPAGKTEEEIFTLGRRFFAFDLVDRHTVNYLKSCRRNGRPHREEVEVRLAFRLALKSRFQLPIQSQSMLYAPSANLTTADFDTAHGEVQAGIDDVAQFAQFMRQWSPLTRYAQHRFASDIGMVHQRFELRGQMLEERSEKGELLDQAYMDAYAVLSLERAEAEHSLIQQKIQALIENAMRATELQPSFTNTFKENTQ
jgi:hypothetical protein